MERIEIEFNVLPIYNAKDVQTLLPTLGFAGCGGSESERKKERRKKVMLNACIRHEFRFHSLRHTL